MSDIKILDIKSDYIFKLVFGSEKNKNVLISFLNAVFKNHPKVMDVQLKNTEITKILAENRSVRLDVTAEIENHTFVDVEIQVRNTGDIIDRGIQYLASLMVENFRAKPLSDQADYTYPKVIGIWVLAEPVTSRLSAVNEAVMTFKKNQLETYQIASEKFRLFTIELTKFHPTKLSRQNMLDVWMTFLKNPLDDKLTSFKEVHQALDTLKEVSADSDVRECYRLRRETEFNYISETNIKTKQARAEGKAEGLIEGKAEGIAEVARKMLDNGIDANAVAKITGLKLEEVTKLNN